MSAKFLGTKYGPFSINGPDHLGFGLMQVRKTQNLRVEHAKSALGRPSIPSSSFRVSVRVAILQQDGSNHLGLW